MSILNSLPPRNGSTWRDALDNSHASVEIDLMRWRLRCDAGVDRDNSHCELIWLFVSVGPLHISLAIGH